jgi:hypothetical protein
MPSTATPPNQSTGRLRGRRQRFVAVLLLTAAAAAALLVGSALARDSNRVAAPTSTSSFSGQSTSGSASSSFTGSGTLGGEGEGSGSDDSGLGSEGGGNGAFGIAPRGVSGVTGLDVAQVRRLQGELARLGYFHHTVTGFYGPVTAAAVKQFQSSAGLKPDGIRGPLSAAALKRRLAGA